MKNRLKSSSNRDNDIFNNITLLYNTLLVAAAWLSSGAVCVIKPVFLFRKVREKNLKAVKKYYHKNTSLVIIIVGNCIILLLLLWVFLPS